MYLARMVRNGEEIIASVHYEYKEKALITFMGDNDIENEWVALKALTRLSPE